MSRTIHFTHSALAEQILELVAAELSCFSDLSYEISNHVCGNNGKRCADVAGQNQPKQHEPVRVEIRMSR